MVSLPPRLPPASPDAPPRRAGRVTAVPAAAAPAGDGRRPAGLPALWRPEGGAARRAADAYAAAAALATPTPSRLDRRV